MKGFFGLGVEGVSKPLNMGAVIRTAHAFGAAFAFSVAPVARTVNYGGSDTSAAVRSLPYYVFPDAGRMVLPEGTRLVGVEITEDAIDLPSFTHPRQAAYVLGPERGGLSAAMLARCDFVVRIPTRFSINLALAGALVVYDRVRTLGRFAPRPVRPGGPTEALPAHVHGDLTPFRRRPAEDTSEEF
ncbi:MAG: TrmH family RNA methyltransferase [Azospirillaceae bacterium]